MDFSKRLGMVCNNITDLSSSLKDTLAALTVRVDEEVNSICQEIQAIERSHTATIERQTTHTEGQNEEGRPLVTPMAVARVFILLPFRVERLFLTKRTTEWRIIDMSVYAQNERPFSYRLSYSGRVRNEGKMNWLLNDDRSDIERAPRLYPEDRESLLDSIAKYVHHFEVTAH